MPTEQLVAAPPTTRQFVSLRDDLRLVKRPARPIRDAQGNQVDVQAGQVVEFRDARFELDLRGSVKFIGGEAPADEVYTFLRLHPLHGDKHEGFWEVEQKAPAVSPEENEALTRAAALLDVEMLQTLLDQERAGWNRPQFVALIEEMHAAAVLNEQQKTAPAPKAKP